MWASEAPGLFDYPNARWTRRRALQTALGAVAGSGLLASSLTSSPAAAQPGAVAGNPPAPSAPGGAANKPQPASAPIDSNALVLGQSTALTGPLAGTAGLFNDAATAVFEQANKQGGIQGRRIQLQVLDDGYVVERTVHNVRSLVAQDAVLALFGVLGVPNTAAALPLAAAAGVPLLFPMNGDAAIRRQPSRWLFTATASFEDEVDRLVAHLRTLGHKQFAVAHLANPFGQALQQAAAQAAQRHQLALLYSVGFALDGSDTGAKAAELAGALRSASETVPVLLAAFAGNAVGFIKALRGAGSQAPLLTFSGVGTDLLTRELGGLATGIVVSQIVPFPWSPAIPVVRDYQAVCRERGQSNYSHLGLWGHISARVTVDALRRAGKNLSRERLIDALEGLKHHDLGQYVLDFGPGRHHGSRFVDISLIGRNGQLIK